MFSFSYFRILFNKPCCSEQLYFLKCTIVTWLTFPKGYYSLIGEDVILILLTKKLMQTDSKYLKEISHVANPGTSGCLRSSQYDRINLVAISKNLYCTVHVVVKKGIHQLLLQTIKILLVVLWTLHLLWLSNNLLYAIFCMLRCSCHTPLYKRPINNIIAIIFFC